MKKLVEVLENLMCATVDGTSALWPWRAMTQFSAAHAGALDGMRGGAVRCAPNGAGLEPARPFPDLGGIFMFYAFARRAFAALALSSLLLAPSAGFAHGPSRQKVVEKIEINAPVDKVWAVIGNFQDLGWVPGVAKTEGTGGNTPDSAKRRLTLSSGGAIDELLTKYDAQEHSLGYRIEQVDVKVLPVNNYSSMLAVTAGGDGKSVVEWRGAFYRGYPNNDPPPELSDEAAIKAVTAIYRSGLEALKAKVEKGQ